MKYISALALMFFSFCLAPAQSLEVLVEHGVGFFPGQRINMVIMGDGYTAADHANNKLRDDATDFMNALLATSPFDAYADFFNFYIIKRNSNEAGADHPEDADDEPNPQTCPQRDVDNAYGSTFDASDIHRLLVAQNQTAVYADLNALFPNYDQIILLVNDQCFGGSGGDIATSSTHQNANEIAIHELGHSFADLADEYYALDIYAGEKANMTEDDNASTVRWSNWMLQNGIDIISHTCPLGAGNCTGGSGFDDFGSWNKPHANCKMRVLNSPFCSVCKEATIDVIYSLASPIRQTFPQTLNVPITNGKTISTSALLILPAHGFRYKWFINNNLQAGEDSSVATWSYEEFNEGNNDLKLQIIDETDMSKSYLPAEGYVFERSWNVIKTNLCPQLVTQFDHLNSFIKTEPLAQSTSDDFNWTHNIDGDGTPSSNTGPNGPYHGDSYYYLEASSPNHPFKTAIAETQCFDISELNSPRMSLAVHMLGDDIGSLSIEASTTAGADNYQQVAVFDAPNKMWEEYEFDLSPFQGKYTRFRFVGTTGNGLEGDIAIDYLRLRENCPTDVVIDATQTNGGTVKALETIKANAKITGSATYRAGNFINLEPGFETLLGRTFTAKIQGCN